METSNERIIEILNDLIRINIDRTEGYERAAHEIRDVQHSEIKTLFFTLAEDSRSYRAQLSETVIGLGGTPAQDSTASGKLYRAWMDVKAAFSRDDLKAALESCEYGEDVALKAYQDALQEDVQWPAHVSTLVSTQRQELRSSHDKVRRYRDEYKVVNNLKS